MRNESPHKIRRKQINRIQKIQFRNQCGQGEEHHEEEYAQSHSGKPIRRELADARHQQTEADCHKNSYTEQKYQLSHDGNIQWEVTHKGKTLDWGI